MMVDISHTLVKTKWPSPHPCECAASVGYRRLSCAVCTLSVSDARRLPPQANELNSLLDQQEQAIWDGGAGGAGGGPPPQAAAQDAGYGADVWAGHGQEAAYGTAQRGGGGDRRDSYSERQAERRSETASGVRGVNVLVEAVSCC